LALCFLNMYGLGLSLINHLFQVVELKKLYIRFIDNYSISQKCIKKEEKENTDYTNFMKEASKSQETNRQTLKVYVSIYYY
jgi:hypothetical protein